MEGLCCDPMKDTGSKRSFTRHLTYSNVIATLALFLALGGGAYAVSKLPAHSVGTKQIKKDAVVSSNVKDGSLLGQDFGAGQLPQGVKGDTGLTGSQGVKGDTGLTGPPGPTASTYASHEPTVPIPFGGADETQVMDLTNGSNGGLLRLDFNARVLVNASILIQNRDTVANTVACRLNIAPQDGLFTPISKLAVADLAPGPGPFSQVPLVGAVDEPAGTYNVSAGCLNPASSQDAQNFLQGDITVVATAR
jgi:hypothetical protein